LRQALAGSVQLTAFGARLDMADQIGLENSGRIAV
jgi:hypothetical protein